MSPNPLRRIPSLSELLENPKLKALAERLRPGEVVSTVRIVLDELATEAHHAATERALPSVSELAERISRRVLEDRTPEPARVINATGIILHPELGSPPWTDSAGKALSESAAGYSLRRPTSPAPVASESERVRARLQALTGAEDAVVFPSAAAATITLLAEVSSGREIVVARGQVIQRNHHYQLPKLAAAASVTLREVGTANCTGIEDYRQALGEQTAAILVVHCPDTGGTEGREESTLVDLVALGREQSVPVIHDLGPASLIDLDSFGIKFAPRVCKSIEAGADLVAFGHELLGGPPCGIVVGRRALLERIERYAKNRAALLEGPVLAGLAATLDSMRSVDESRAKVPVIQLLTASADNLKNRAERLAPQMAAANAIEAAEVVEAAGMLLGPTHTVGEMAGWAIALRPSSLGVGPLAEALRDGTPAVVGQVAGDQLLLNLRSVLARQDLELVERIEQIEP